MSEALSSRKTRLIESAQALFGRRPAFIVRAPGRVNLIGEHTDYNMLPVLPMAIERSVLIAGVRRDDRMIVLRNVGSFPQREFELAPRIPRFTDGDWGNYAKAAAHGLIDLHDELLLHGADLLVDGDIPSGAGLSSSSALVVACALALLAANDAEIPFATLAELLPKAERYVGTLSGGMDQTVSLLAQAGHALRIDFAPLRYRPVPLPQDMAIVVCDSLVQAEKSGAAKHGYNRRVLECRLACRVLNHNLRSELDEPLASLGALQRLFPQRALASFVDLLAAVLPDAPLTLAEIASIADSTESELRHSCSISAEQTGTFSVLARARHVLTEAIRVDRAEESLLANDSRAFGELMNESHRSCRDDYEISCAELDQLVDVAKDAGALGARLTGAGFGGCTVSLVPRARLTHVLEQVDEEFYAPRLAGRSSEEFRFVFTPQPGAGVEPL